MMKFSPRDNGRSSASGQPGKKISILLIGPLPPPIGGDTTLFSYLVEDLLRNDQFDVQTLNTARGSLWNNQLVNLWAALRVVAGILSHGARVDIVSFHANRRGMFMFGPLVYAITRLYRKPLAMRLFGGWFHKYYEARGRFGQWLLRNTVLSAERCLFETKGLVAFFQQVGRGNPSWLSNYTRLELTRAKRPNSSYQRTTCKRLVFVGRVKVMKGIDTILECAGKLPDGVSIDVYGPLHDYTAEQIDEGGQGQIRYRGVLGREQIVERLWDYDALLLPTFFDTEGYPGVIIEAFCAEMPVITTRRGAIPEIVDDSCGILIEPGNSQELRDAIQYLCDEPARFVSLCEGAKSRQQQFSDKVWTSKFIQFCEQMLSANCKDFKIQRKIQNLDLD